MAFDVHGRWELSSKVALRPERFGALAYDFETRRLSFLKDRRLLQAVEGLASSPDAAAACRRAGIGDDELPRYARALGTLADTGMIRRAGAEAAA